MTTATGITDAKEIYAPVIAIGIPFLVLVILTVLLVTNWRAVLAEVRRPFARAWAWWDVRCQKAEARLAQHEAAERRVRRITKAEMNAEAMRLEIECPATRAALDDWCDAVLADLLPEDTEPIAVEWPQPLDPRVHDRALMLPDPQPMPVKWEPLVLPPETYLNRAAQLANDWLDPTVEVYDEYSYAEGVIRNLHSTVDAPVSPAPWMPQAYRARHDADNPPAPAHVIGYDRVAVRTLNEATGAFPVLEMAGAR